MIGGNLKATIQVKTTSTNDLGENVLAWTDKYTLNGWLDLSSGTSTYSHKTKTEDSTHIFISDYNPDIRDLDITQCRFKISNRIYEVKFIDDPMEIHDHLEITLNLLGVTNAK